MGAHLLVGRNRRTSIWERCFINENRIWTPKTQDGAAAERVQRNCQRSADRRSHQSAAKHDIKMVLSPEQLIKRRAASRRWWLKNRARVRETSLAWYWNHREDVQARRKAFKEAHPKRVAAWYREYNPKR